MKKLLTMTAALMLLCTQLYAGNGDLIVGGNLGVGTTAAVAKLDILGGDIGQNSGDTLLISRTSEQGSRYFDVGSIRKEAGSSYANSGIRLKASNSDNSTGNAWIDMWIGANVADNKIAFGEGNTTEWMRIDNGKVGIGTTIPWYNLQVQSTGTGSAATVAGFRDSSIHGNELLFLNADGEARIYATYEGTSIDSDLSFWTTKSSGAQAEVMRLTSQGNVGIGKMPVPGRTVDVNGPVYANEVQLTSDVNFKKDIQPISTPLDKLVNLNGVSYEWRTDEYKDKGFPEGRHYGVIAQEIEKVLPEVVNTAPDGTKSVAYTEIIPVLIEAMKAQHKAIDAQKEAIGTQQEEINNLKALVKELSMK